MTEDPLVGSSGFASAHDGAASWPELMTLTFPILLLGALSFALSWSGTLLVRGLAVRANFVDRPGPRKVHAQPIALGGGIAIFAAFALPILIVVAAARIFREPPALLTRIAGRDLARHWSGIHDQTFLALGILAGAFVLHLLGLRDDRKALGPYVKLIVQLVVIATIVIACNLRALTTLGPVVSILLTVLWIGTITNAFNFLDNMDGLSAGVAAVCTTAFLITALMIQQWFVAAALALLLGALLGFLCFNFAPASIFMGDSGSLVIGFLLGVLTIRTTYLPPELDQNFGAGWYAVFAPLIVLAVPLYDFMMVTVIRLSHGRSPFVGDTNHFSHRLVARGMSKRTAVLCLYLISAATAVAAIILPHAPSTFIAILIFVQTLLVLGVVALLEQHPLPVDNSPDADGDREHPND